MKIKLKKQTEFELLFTADKPQSLQVGKWYEIKPYKKNRSLEQNKMIWAILTIIQEHTGTDKWELYLNLLEQVGVLVEYLEAIPEAEATLKRVYRIVEVKEHRLSSRGVKTCLFKCYVGSSTFNTNEMKILLDESISLASSLGIQIDVEALEVE